MSLEPGTRLGPFEIIAPLGAGGMGEVVRARDTRLGRDVAIKSLPDAFAQDPERLARFEREARLLASLSHPNVAGIHGLELVEGHRYLVLEFIEGESLAQRLARGPLGIADTIAIARQVAAGLEAAHEAGVVHRDLKPGNIMLKPDGDVKVLDFGLAKGRTADGKADPNLSASPTMTYAMTTAGMILGTAAYMSPEQARGRPVDRRTDIWSFGCVLFECLTGKQAFAGETVSDVIARILQTEPDWSALPAATPRRLRDLLKRCLQRDTRERQRDIGDVRLELGLPEERADAAAGVAMRPAMLPWLVAAALALLLVALAAATLGRSGGAGTAPMTLAFTLPADITVEPDPTSVVLSPDGAKVVFAARDTSGVRRLGMRHLDRDDARMFANTEAAWQPFWSPDSKRVGYFANGKLYSIGIETGTVQALCDAPLPRGGAWGDGFIVLQPRSQGPLMKIAEDGGVLTPTTTLVAGPGVSGHRFPSFLPDGKHFLYSIIPGDPSGNPIAVGSLDGAAEKKVAVGFSGAVFAAPGYLLYLHGNDICAQRFDARALRTQGAPVTVPGLRAIAPQASGAPLLSASVTGALVQHDAESVQRLHWIDRAGRVSAPLALPAGIYGRFHISHDGRRAVLEYAGADASNSMVWIADLGRETMQRMTFDGENYTPCWSRDDRTIFLSHVDPTHPGHQDLWSFAADTPGSLRLVVKMASVFNSVLDPSADGTSVLSRTQGTDTQQDIMLVSPGAREPVRPLVASNFNEPLAALSPDGHTLAYLSDESGRMELYARSFPALSGQRAVSVHGAYGDATASSFAGQPKWRRDGRELVFLDGDTRTVMAVDVTPGEPAQFGTPHPLFRLPRGVSDMAATPDCGRFLVALVDENSSRSVDHILLNWSKLVANAK